MIPGGSFEDEFESIVRTNGHNLEHHRRFDASAEDAAGEFERAMLQDSPAQKSRKKTSDAKKRPVPNFDSDIEDEVDRTKSISMPGPTKRRKLDNDTTSTLHNGIEHAAAQDPISLKLSISKLKGKGKLLQRELSHDSVSASVTPKGRKKPGPRKKIGLAVEVDNEQLSRPSSLMGDVTPAVSRPNSPAPTNTTMVYELDEQVPPMKKAKKVDDVAMVKRIKSLEEAQRKVWTNIARRDVAKVCTPFLMK